MVILDSGRKPCYFCGAKTVRFKEHYNFCPECSVIYTNYIKLVKGCQHVNNETPNVLHPCWFKDKRESKVYLTPHSKCDTWWRCSECGDSSECDGW